MSEPHKELFNDEDQEASNESLQSADGGGPEDQQVASSASEDEADSDHENFTDDEADDNDEDEDADDNDGHNGVDNEIFSRHSAKRLKKSKKLRVAQFIDDEAELSGDDLVSEDEAELSDDDQLDTQLVDQDAKDLGSDEEEEVRRLYHKQLETDDRRQLLLLQEQLEENEIAIGQRRRRKFRWQTKDIMENSLKRHYDPDDEDSQEGMDDEEDDFNYDELNPRLRRPTGDALLIGSTRVVTKNTQMIDPYEDQSQTNSNSGLSRTYSRTKAVSREAGPSLLSDDSNSNTMSSRLISQTSRTNTTAISDMNRYLYRDKEIVEALSTREAVVVTREEKDRVIQRELKRVLQSKSIFDQLYS